MFRVRRHGPSGGSVSIEEERERAAAGQRGDKAGPRGKGQYGGR